MQNTEKPILVTRICRSTAEGERKQKALASPPRKGMDKERQRVLQSLLRYAQTQIRLLKTMVSCRNLCIVLRDQVDTFLISNIRKQH